MLNKKSDIYVVCVLCAEENGDYYYVPVVDISEDLSTVYIAASPDIVAVQIRGADTIRNLARNGLCPIVVPVKAPVFKEMYHAIIGRTTIMLNAYNDVINEYKDMMKILGGDAINPDLTFSIYNAMVANNAPVKLTKDFEVVENKTINVADDLYDGLCNFTLLNSSNGNALLMNSISNSINPDDEMFNQMLQSDFDDFDENGDEDENE